MRWKIPRPRQLVTDLVAGIVDKTKVMEIKPTVETFEVALKPEGEGAKEFMTFTEYLPSQIYTGLMASHRQPIKIPIAAPAIT